jgi:ATP-dependent helicase/nuclease subunit A
MGSGTLTIYSASAGSGKTFKLTGIYLASLFRSRYNYRKILAVTFTNKATAEMKNRILDHLYNLSVGKESGYFTGLIKSTGKTEESIRLEAKEILFSILHDYSRFSVTTIDAFFQKMLRAFTREAGLQSGFNIEIDHSIILSSAVDDMIASSGENKKLKKWLIDYAMANLDEEKSWRLKDGIMKLAEELFSEKYKILSSAERSKLEDKEFLLHYIEKIRSITTSFEKSLLEYGIKCEKIFFDYGLSDEMFYNKSRGVPGFIRSLAIGKTDRPNDKVRAINDNPPRWSTQDISSELREAINGGLEATLKETIRYYDDNIKYYESSKVILSNIYALGILSDVLNKVYRITNSENRFLLSDAGELLNLITKEDQASFIYEKVGTRYENYMIDEFQDTSIIQWNNFNPLIQNSMSEGFDNLVVGDVKQSIYRWRNSDWKILGTILAETIDNERIKSEPLKTNWRSRKNIIRFNNALFSLIPQQIDEELAVPPANLSVKTLFSEAIQDDPGINTGGYVRLEFIDDEIVYNEETGNRKKKRVELKWEKKVLDKLPEVIELFQDKGYRASDIGIIVRNGKEGTAVLNKLVEYSNSCSAEKKAKYNYNIISNDSLALSNSHAVNFLIAVFSVINNPDDFISKAQMLRFYLLATGVKDADKASLKKNELKDGIHGYFPDGCDKFMERIRYLPLFEMVENLISFFGLGKYPWNVAYLNTFQDWVIGFTATRNPGLQQFLDWWETTGRTKSVVFPGSQNASGIYTIHKSKGLEFRIVILPFLSWNLDHKNSRQPFLWVKPDEPPFNELGIVPVKYKSGLAGTIFEGSYFDEKFSSYLDNINLLYVAMTRAKDAIWGFAPENPGYENAIAGIVKSAITSDLKISGLAPGTFFDKEKRVFELGEIIEYKGDKPENNDITSMDYPVSFGMKSLKLKMHGENYFSSANPGAKEKLNYGKLMHEVFENIKDRDDIAGAISKLVLEGKITIDESVKLEGRINLLVNTGPASDWFLPGNKILAEAEILLPDGITRRPDRIILKDDKAVVVDFKFGEENPHYLAQVKQYRKLICDMGYASVDAFIWYVDINKIVSV